MSGAALHPDLSRSRVYVVGYTPAAYAKIGTATSVRQRLGALRCGHPNQYALQLLVDIPGGVEHEAAVHRRFRHLHHDREWFVLRDELSAFVTDALAAVAEARHLDDKLAAYQGLAAKWDLAVRLWAPDYQPTPGFRPASRRSHRQRINWALLDDPQEPPALAARSDGAA